MGRRLAVPRHRPQRAENDLCRDHLPESNDHTDLQPEPYPIPIASQHSEQHHDAKSLPDALSDGVTVPFPDADTHADSDSEHDIVAFCICLAECVLHPDFIPVDHAEPQPDRQRILASVCD